MRSRAAGHNIVYSESILRSFRPRVLFPYGSFSPYGSFRPRVLFPAVLFSGSFSPGPFPYHWVYDGQDNKHL